MKKAVFKGHIVDLLNNRIYGGEITIDNGKISSITECEVDDNAPYCLPGFIDSHVHIESSMMTPVEYARIAVRFGTVGVICDPHEIANVLGTKGIDMMLEMSKLTSFHFAFGMPSCVPSCSRDIETSGYILGPDVVEEYMKRSDIYFLAEMMNFPGVISGDKDVMAKIAAAKAAGKPVDGHAPGLLGNDRAKYSAAGISTDHECNTLETGRSAIECGMHVLIREGSAAKDYAALAPLISEAPGKTMFCTDDCHPNDFVLGHIDRIVRRAISEGYDVMDVLTAACLTPVQHYNLQTGLVREGDNADFIILSDLTSNFKVLESYIAGKLLFSADSEGVESIICKGCEQKYHDIIANVDSNFHAKPIGEADIARTPGNEEMIIVASDGSLFTLKEKGPVTPDVQKLVVLDRYSENAVPRVAYIKGFGIKHGAIAQTIAHDCHNLVAVGSDDREIVRAINSVVEMKGGIAVTDGVGIEVLELPFGGLLSLKSGDELASSSNAMHSMLKKMGCKIHSPFITLGFMCLPVIPQLKLTDKGLFDSENFCFIDKEDKE